MSFRYSSLWEPNVLPLIKSYHRQIDPFFLNIEKYLEEFQPEYITSNHIQLTKKANLSVIIDTIRFVFFELYIFKEFRMLTMGTADDFVMVTISVPVQYYIEDQTSPSVYVIQNVEFDNDFDILPLYAEPYHQDITPFELFKCFFHPDTNMIHNVNERRIIIADYISVDKYNIMFQWANIMFAQGRNLYITYALDVGNFINASVTFYINDDPIVYTIISDPNISTLL